MLGILSGLDAMHQADVLHRDLKPSNIVIAPGRPEIVKLIDFGIARPTGAEETKLTVTGMILGTPRYMAPEQVLFYPMDARTDLYAAGLLFYEMLAGDLPFPGEKLTDVMRRLNEPVRPPMAPGRLPPIPDSISEVLVASLQLNADQRPASAREYSDRLIGIEQQEVQPAEAPSATDPTAARAGVGTEEPRLSSFSFETQSTRPPAEPDKPDEKQKVATLDTLMAAGEEEEERRYLLVAKLPPSRLSNPEERKWLAALTGVDGRSYVMGAQFWLAMQLDPESEESAQGQATRIIEALTKRYGATGRAAHCLVDEGFTFTSASLTGASPLPRELRGLMKELG